MLIITLCSTLNSLDSVTEILAFYKNFQEMRIEKEIDFFSSIRNYCGDFFLKENSPFHRKNGLLWSHCQESDCYRVFMWNVKLANIGAKCLYFLSYME